ncbi:MAG: RNA polymerase sigma factor [Verrucomicrobiaceae bacterium]|nr:MAG: RNA polymerase sigma factor [Verrucomicrobiaceae bacterium]
MTSSADDDDHEWAAWLAEHAARFLLFARQQTRCAADAEDVLQESLVETWRRARGRPETALVFATIRRRAIDLGRRTDRRLHREEAGAAPEAAWFVPEGSDAETTALLETEVRRLPPPQRDVVTLKVWGGLTFSEIASALEIPPGTAASRYRLALESLRQTLTPVLS